MKYSKATAQLVALAALALLTAQCGEDAEVTARQISEYISSVTSPDGRASSTLREGQPPAPSGGATPTVEIGSATVLTGGDLPVAVSSDVPFATILLVVGGANGYFEITFPEDLGRADIVIGLSDDVPDDQFGLDLGIAYPDGLVSEYVGGQLTVTDEPSCGDGVCNGDETTATCSQDCPAQAVCGDGTCSGDETTETCVQDCPAEPTCGDGACNGDETPETCSNDCRACTADSECEVTERCDERACRTRVENSPCTEDEQCPGVLYCSRGVCQDGTTGDLCDGQADCVNPNDVCDTTCQTLEEGDACQDGACGTVLYCGPDTTCYDGSEADPCDANSQCAVAGNYCGPDDACHDGSSGDPCNSTDDCDETAEECTDANICAEVEVVCGNDRCDGDEDWNSCPDDCDDVCGDGVCDATEQLVSPSDGAFCAEDCQVTVIMELNANTNPPGTGEGAWIVGQQAEFGSWTPNTVPLLDDGVAPDIASGDLIFTAAFLFDPGTALEYKYTIGESGADWGGTEEYAAGNNRGYVVPSDGLRELRISDVWAEEPASAGGQGASTTVTVESAACVFDESCDPSRETPESCPTECGPCDPNPCYEGVECTVGAGEVAECGACPDDGVGDGFTCCFSDECPGNGTQECNEEGVCEPKDCNRFAGVGGGPPEGYCGSGECFEGQCVEGVCVELCDDAYGPYEAPIGGWWCSLLGYCSIRMCSGSSDCGSVSECVNFDSSRPGGLDDQICISHDASPCSGNCQTDDICYTEGEIWVCQ